MTGQFDGLRFTVRGYLHEFLSPTRCEFFKFAGRSFPLRFPEAAVQYKLACEVESIIQAPQRGQLTAPIISRQPTAAAANTGV